MRKRRLPLPVRPDVPARPDVPRAPFVATPSRRGWRVVLVAGVSLLIVASVAAGLSTIDRGQPGGAASGSPAGATPTTSPLDPPAGPQTSDGPFGFIAKDREGDPIRWDPCTPIHYEVNLRYAPTGALEIARRAADRVGEATGISFVFDGTTQRTAEQTQDRLFRDEHFRLYPVLLSWVEAREFRLRYGDPVKYAAIGLPFQGQDADRGWYGSGILVVNEGAGARAAFLYRGDLGPLLLHELGHIMGLAHVRDGDEIMWSSDLVSADANPDPFLVDYGDGDLAGLRALGIEAGCQPAA